MTRHELKEQIRTSYSESYKNITTKNAIPGANNNGATACTGLDSIKEACRAIPQETQMHEAYIIQKKSFLNNTKAQWSLAFSTIAVLLVACITLGSMVVQKAPVKNPTGTPVTDPVKTVAVGVTDIIIDVNPSIEIILDEERKVLSCEPLNEDANSLLGDLDLTGVNSKVAFNTVVGVLYLNGYLQGETDAMLVSIDAKDEAGFDETEKEFLSVMDNSTMPVTVMIQGMEKEKLVEEAKEYEISPGKLELIDRIVDISADYTRESVKELSVQSIHYLTDLYRLVTSPSNGADISANDIGAADAIDAVDKIVDDTLNGTGKIVDDTLNGAGEIVDDTINGAGKIVDDTLNGAEKIIDDTLNGVGEIAGDTLDSVDKLVNQTLDGVERFFIIVH